VEVVSNINLDIGSHIHYDIHCGIGGGRVGSNIDRDIAVGLGGGRVRGNNFFLSLRL